MGYRVGQGFDSHPLVPGRRLVLGGVQIAYPRGLQGHSDGDVAAHALANAILGALGEGDLGQHFPDHDPRYAGADSIGLLNEVWRTAAGKDGASPTLTSQFLRRHRSWPLFCPQCVCAWPMRSALISLG
jgi:2-C-methyl-D-erythritol 2,4-cyclodiphosphate synthase